MSAISWVQRQRDRPIAERERRTAMAVVVVLLGAVAVLLTLTQPTSKAGGTAQGASRGAPTTLAAALEGHTREAERDARRFLAGYLPYAYGQAPANRITGATRSLIVSLEADPPRVPPASRARHPRVRSLHPTAAPAGEFAVSAVVNDGGLIDYPVGLLLVSEHGRLLVSGLEGE
ncbi:MAG TPA: hypothetical protein VGY76_01545 [Solirubrobacteraceae bacterium]|nr:hypothetical protein [Solirubrobacteraceae bacterium]